MNDSLLSLQQLQCQYNKSPAVQDFSLQVEQGEIISILGPSGCGKTTLLRAIVGLEPLTAGSITFDNTLFSKPSYIYPTEKRNIGLVFQDYTLFPHMTVAENVCFGMQAVSKQQCQQTTLDLLGIVGLEDLSVRYPHELSGGQQQRAAIARALATDPKLILLDEPFCNLDSKLRKQLSQEIRDILKDQGMTCILVTHDQEEAFAFGEKVAVMHEGQLQQFDTPSNIYHHPSNRFVADFVGRGIFVSGTVANQHSIDTKIGALIPEKDITLPKGTSVEVLIRPEAVKIDAISPLKGTIKKKAFKGANILYTLTLPSNETLLTLLPSDLNFEIGNELPIRVEPKHVEVFI